MSSDKIKRKIIKKIIKKGDGVLSSIANFDLTKISSKFVQIIHEERSRINSKPYESKIDFTRIYKYKNVYVEQAVFMKRNTDNYKDCYESPEQYLDDIIVVHDCIENAIGNISDIDLIFHVLGTREKFFAYLQDRY